MRSIKSCKKGETIEHPGGNKYLILARLEQIAFLSEANNPNAAYYRPWHVKELEVAGFRILLEGRTPMTRKEAEHYLNVKITK